jgi:hypothetical protein
MCVLDGEQRENSHVIEVHPDAFYLTGLHKTSDFQQCFPPLPLRCTHPSTALMFLQIVKRASVLKVNLSALRPLLASTGIASIFGPGEQLYSDVVSFVMLTATGGRWCYLALICEMHPRGATRR